MKRNVFLMSVVFVFVLFAVQLTSQNQYNAARGDKLFVEQCSKCHRKDGSGIKMVYPPTKKSDYIQKQDNIELLRGMIYGRSGKIVVNGYSYNGVMTTEIDKSLSEEDIANILTFVLQKQNGINKFVSVKDVKEAKKAGKLPVHK